MLPQSPSIIAGIDIGSNTTRVIITEHTEDNSMPRVIGIGKSDTLGISKGYVIHEDDATRSLLSAIHMAETMAGIKLEHAYVCINGISLETSHETTTLILEKQTITEKDISAALHKIKDDFLNKNKNRSLLHTIPLMYHLDEEELFADPIGLSGNKLTTTYSLVSCLTQHRDGIINVVSKADINIIDIIASPIAASVVALPKRVRTAGAVLVDIGSETLSISVFEHDTLIHTAVIPCGASLITNDLALGLQIPLDEAEEIKFGKRIERATVSSKKRVQEIIEARIMDMLEIIKKKLTLWNRDRLLPGGITLIGGGSQHEHIDTYARNFLKLPVQIVQPEKIIPSKRGLDTSWLAVYGICFLGNQQPQYRATGVNLKKLFKDTSGTIKGFFEQFLP